MNANKRLVTELIDALNRKDFNAIDAIVAPDARRHCRATPGVTVECREDFRALLEQDASTFPDATQEIRLLISEGDHVAALVSFEGTQQAPFGPFPATGKRVETDFLSILRISDGLIAEMWIEWDNLTLLAQLGLGPMAEG